MQGLTNVDPPAERRHGRTEYIQMPKPQYASIFQNVNYFHFLRHPSELIGNTHYAMKSWKFVLLGLSGLVRFALCTQGDICYVLGAKSMSGDSILKMNKSWPWRNSDHLVASLIDDRLFFMSGNYSSVSFDSQEIAPSKNTPCS